jgi:putative ABC transport system permease protein
MVIAVPLGVLGAWALASYFAGLFNFDITSISVPPGVLALQVAAGLIVPLLAALAPVLSGARITVREAIRRRRPSISRPLLRCAIAR